MEENNVSFWEKVKRNKTLVLVGGGLIALFVVGFIFSTSPSSQQKEAPQPGSGDTTNAKITEWPKENRVPGQIMVKFNNGVSDAKISEILAPFNAKIKGKIEGINTTIVEVPVGQEEQVLQALVKDSLVEYAEPDYVQTVHFTPNDTNYVNQWGLKNSGQSIGGRAGKVNSDINVEVAWDVTKGAGVVVAVLDTGIDLNHPDLAGKITGQRVFVTTTIDDKLGHGTHVAGIIAANSNNSQGIAGVCPDCTLLIGKAMNDDGSGMASSISQGITWAADNGAKVINVSSGGPQATTAQQTAVDYAWGKGAVVVSSAGNESSATKSYPAAYPNAVSVGATDNTDIKSTFSNFGTWVDVTAPGTAIFSTLPTKAFGLQSKAGVALNYDYLSGTSMSGPIVAGAVALLFAQDSSATPQTIVQKLYTTSDKIAGTGQYWVQGRINIGKAFATAAVTPTPSTPSVIPSAACLGSCPTLPVTPTTPIGGVSVTVAPSSPTTVSVVPSEIIQVPTDVVSPTTGVGITDVPVPSVIIGDPGQGGGAAGDQQGLIFRFIALLLQLIFQLLGSFGVR